MKKRFQLLFITLVVVTLVFNTQVVEAGLLISFLNDPIDTEIAQGDTSIYEFLFVHRFEFSGEFDFYRHIMILPAYTPDEVFFSFEPTELITEVQSEPGHVSSGEGRNYTYIAISVYISNPQLEPSPEAYPLKFECNYYDNSSGEFELVDSSIRTINLTVIPEPSTLSILALGAILAGRKRRTV